MFNQFNKFNVIENVKTVGAYLTEHLNQVVNDYEIVRERRGNGINTRYRTYKLILKMSLQNVLDNGLILFSAGTNVIRFVPPLVITTGDVDEMIEKLRKVLDEFI